MKNGKEALSVSALTQLIKQSLETTFPRVWVQGEISNAKLHTSGHFYFTLKDEGAQISAVMWRSKLTLLSFQPEDGMKILAFGSITVYPPRGNYQIDVVKLQPLGVGELQLAFEQLKRRLSEEGLFDPEHKKPLPEFPASIGVITSETGAALHDIWTVLQQRFPSVEVILYPVRVQGHGAAEEIAHAIREMNRFGQVDVIIVGRGGGSLEDLWAFNEEIVARAIYNSTIPIISAVGHEIDFSIADFVADLRAPTPSAAAAMVVRDRRELLEILGNISYTMRQSLAIRVQQARDQIRSLLASYSFNRPRDLLNQYAQRVDEIDRTLGMSLRHRLQIATQRHRSLHQRLEILKPANALRRGYAIVRRNGAIVTRATELKRGDEATLQFHDGSVPARIEKE